MDSYLVIAIADVEAALSDLACLLSWEGDQLGAVSVATLRSAYASLVNARARLRLVRSRGLAGAAD